MPNWVRTYANFEGELKDIHRVFDMIRTESKDRGNLEVNYCDFNKLIPVPTDLLGNDDKRKRTALAYYMIRSGKENDMKKPVFTYDRNEVLRQVECDDEMPIMDWLKAGEALFGSLEKYGTCDSMDWRIENWGTKWNAANSERPTPTKLMFETAWSFPEGAMRALGDLCAENNVWMYGEWADEDLGINTGCFEGGYGREFEYEPYGDLKSVAFEAYINCWGESECIYQDNYGTYHRYECGNCPRPCN